MAVLKDERFVKDRQNAMTPELAALQRRMPRAFKPLERNIPMRRLLIRRTSGNSGRDAPGASIRRVAGPLKSRP